MNLSYFFVLEMFHVVNLLGSWWFKISAFFWVFSHAFGNSNEIRVNFKNFLRICESVGEKLGYPPVWPDSAFLPPLEPYSETLLRNKCWSPPCPLLPPWKKRWLHEKHGNKLYLRWRKTRNRWREASCRAEGPRCRAWWAGSRSPRWCRAPS